jgi:di/tricarboxylate transporter
MSSAANPTAPVFLLAIKTAGAQNMVALGFIEKELQPSISWTDWFIAGAPFSALLSVAVYLIMTRMMKSEMAEIDR